MPLLYGARDCLTFVKTTAIAYGQILEAPGNFLPICNSSRFCKRQAITSMVYDMVRYDMLDG